MTYRFNNPSIDDVAEKPVAIDRSALRLKGVSLVGILKLAVVAMFLSVGGLAAYFRHTSNHSLYQLGRLQNDHTSLIDRHFDVLANRYELTAIDPRLQSQYLRDAREFLNSYVTSRNTTAIAGAKETNSITDSSHVVTNLLHSTSGPNYRHIDVSVDDASTGKFIEGLSRIDFELSIGDERLSSVVVQKLPFSREKRAIAILQDKSGSMKGVPDSKACAAVDSFVSATSIYTWQRIWKFSDFVRPVTPWTTDKTVLRAACLPDEPNGATALYSSLLEVLKDLATRSERKSLIVITDGVESFGTHLVSNIVDRANEAQIHIYPIGLKSETLNEVVLKQFASGTGGAYFRADNPQDLQRCLIEVAITTARPSYRLITLIPMPSDLPVQIRVGDSTLSVPLESTK